MTTAKRCALTSGYLILAVLIAVGFGAGIVRLIDGMGTTTNLSDDYPWGLWIVFDLFFCPFAAGAFMIAAVTHIYNRREYHTIARPVILAGFLGEVFVVVVLLMDLGRWHQFYNVLLPWNWNLRSFMFQVSICLTLYVGVLLMEVAPTILERLNWQRALRMIRPLAVVIAGAGVVLSALHQSALGSLFLLMPYKLHPMWWTPLLPLLFFTSAAFGGLAMAILVAVVSFRAFRRRLEPGLLTDLARIVSIMLGFYLVLKIGDLLRFGELGLVFSQGWLSLLFLAEITIGVIVPMVLFGRRQVRESGSGLVLGSTCVLVGLALNRTSVALLALSTPAGAFYFPHWMEIVVAAASIAAGVLIFIAAAYFLPVLPESDATRRRIIPSGWPRWRVPLTGLFLFLLTAAAVVLLLQPVAQAGVPEPEPVPAAASATYAMAQSATCQKCHADPVALMSAGADKDMVARLTIEPGPPDMPHGRLGCVTCHQGRGSTENATAVHAGVVVDPSQGDPNRCLSCHRDLPAEFPEDRLRTPHDELVHGEVANVSCSDCHGGVAHGYDPVSGEVICPMSVCLDCHQTRRLDSEFTDCGACHIASHGPVVGMTCNDCHRATDVWQVTDVATHPLELTGGHAEVQCFDCHQKPIPARRVTSQCSGCHQPPREPHYGSACEECHTPTSFEGARLPTGMHPIALVGAHQTTGCEGCHDGDQKTLEFICSDCHERPENHLQGDCDICHTPNGWARSVAFLVDLVPHVSHGLGGRDECLLCHDVQGSVEPAPCNHMDYVNEQCTVCHKSTE